MTEGLIRPAAMEGGGAYNRNSIVQEAGSSPAVRLMEAAARLVAIPAPAAPVVIADYGSSQGHNSFAPISLAIGAIRERAGLDQPVSVVHVDLPSSDFSALFQALATDPRSYLATDPNSFASAAGRSFYEQVLPTGSVTLGWSSWAVQWLSRAPLRIPDHVQVAYSRDEAVRRQYFEQAARDWQTFLHHRARELHSGGRLVVLTMSQTEAGDFGYGPILDALYGALLELVSDGFLSEAELREMAIPTVGRSLSDLQSPFANGSFEGLVLEHAELFLGDDPLWSAFERNGDAEAYAAGWAAFSRASVLPTLALGLGGGAGDPRATPFMEKVEAGMTTRLRVHPERIVIPLAAITMRKD